MESSFEPRERQQAAARWKAYGLGTRMFSIINRQKYLTDPAAWDW